MRTEITPNPATRRFVFEHELHEGEPVSVRRGDGQSGSVARALFEDPRIEAVLIGRDFVTVTAEVSSWRPGLVAGIVEQLEAWRASGRAWVPLEDVEAPPAVGDPELVYKIETLLDWEVRPSLAQHGGDVGVVSIVDGTLTLSMRGACDACPSSSATLHDTIEARVRSSLPEIRQVVQEAP